MRLLAPHEYTQIAGRAGRRGIDKVGKVWLCCNLFEIPSLYDFQNMLSGRPQTLISKFKISFSLCLNIISTSNDLNKILEFANQSLITNEINKEKDYYDKTINEINEIISNKEKLLDTIRTDTSIINDYISKKKILSNSNNKQRKN